MEEKILNILQTTETYVSGEYLSNNLNVSRTSIWKHIKNLRSKGYVIDAISNKGYKIISSPDKINKSELLELLKTKYIGQNIFYFDTIDSTNIKAKELANKNVVNGSIVIAEKQTLGSGRFNRVWSSPNGGLWFTLILQPSIPPNEAPKITQIAAAAVYKTLKKYNIISQIKWPNDILINDKKFCGILAEMKCDMDSIHYLSLGIGMNINLCADDFDENIKDSAVSLKILYNKNFNRTEILANFLNTFEELYISFLTEFNLSETIAICRENSTIWGKKAKLITYNSEEIVTCISLSDTGDLIVKDSNGNKKYVFSGEITFKSVNN